MPLRASAESRAPGCCGSSRSRGRRRKRSARRTSTRGRGDRVHHFGRLSIRRSAYGLGAPCARSVLVQVAMSSIDANVAASLARHEQRRRQGIPTVSLLVGPPGIGASTWREWIASQGRAVAACHAPDEHAALRAWIAAATEGHDLRALAAAAVARHMGDEPEDLLRRIERTAAHERALLLDQATDGLDPPLSRVCRRVLDGAPAAPEPGASWGVEGLLGPEGSHAGSTLDGIARLLPAHAGPGLLFAPRETLPPGDWLRHVVALASAFVEERPGLSVAVASHVSLADLPESRAKALLREGEVWLPCLGARDVAAILSAHGATAERAPASSV